jgi:hypothetical protein
MQKDTWQTITGFANKYVKVCIVAQAATGQRTAVVY